MMPLTKFSLSLFASMCVAPWALPVVASERSFVPVSNLGFQGFSGHCFSYAAVSYANTVAGLSDTKSFRAKTSLILLTLYEPSPYIHSLVFGHFARGSHYYDGGDPSSLLGEFGKFPEILIPISDKLDWELGAALLNGESVKSFHDQNRVRELASKRFYRSLTKLLKKKGALSEEARAFVESMKKIGLHVDESQKKIVYRAVENRIPSAEEERLKSRGLADLMAVPLYRLPNDKCETVAAELIQQSLEAGHPALLSYSVRRGMPGVARYAHVVTLYSLEKSANTWRVKYYDSGHRDLILSKTTKFLCFPDLAAELHLNPNVVKVP